MGQLGDWLEERMGFRGALRAAFGEAVRGGTSWAYVFGSVLTFLLLLQAATGVLLAMYYAPSAQTAWASVAYIQDQVSFGWLIRGLHANCASAMVIVGGMHLFQTALYGAYKRPRELNWIVGVLMLGVIGGFALSGYLLPWDQKGYWATKVTTGIMGSVPLLGEWLKKLVQGGNEYGNLTLTRFYAFHVFLLPAGVATLLALHLRLFRRHGVTPRWGKSDAALLATIRPFWPDQMAKDMVAIAAAFAAVLLVTVLRHGVPLEAPANPASAYDARPEWYFLPLFQLLKYFHGLLETIAALVVPALVGGSLLALPFLDRGPDRAPQRRRLPLAALTGAGVVFLLLAFLAVRQDALDPAFAERKQHAEAASKLARELARTGVPAAGGTAVFTKAASPGEPLFQKHCAGCHRGEERKGPELLGGYNSRRWIRELLQNPDDPRFFGLVAKVQSNPKRKMPPAKLAGPELDAAVEWIYAQTGAADVDPALSTRGLELIEEGPCTDCHDIEEGGEGAAPLLSGRGSRAYLMALIADSGQRRFFGTLDEMPAFLSPLPQAGTAALTAAEVGLLADYLDSLRDVPWAYQTSGGKSMTKGR